MQHETDDNDDEDDTTLRFMARHSAHAEPRAAQRTLDYLIGLQIPDHSRVAVVTDHFAIAHAQRHFNGFGGIGMGLALNKQHEFGHNLWETRSIEVTLFYIQGPVNPAGSLSRNFGELSDSLHAEEMRGVGLP